MAEPSQMATSPALAVRGLSFDYGERRALDDVSLSVERGEIFGILGPNGGGKSTLFNVLSTLEPCATGRVELLGHDLAASLSSVRRSIGVVFQSPSIDTQLTVRENLRHQGHLYGLSGGALAARIETLLERFELASRATERAARLSGGLMRRLEIAKALLHEPELLILDEPSTGLDPGIRRQIWDLFDELRRERGVTVLLTTHFMEEGDRCDRLALLDRGRIAAVGSPEELKGEVGGEVVLLGSPRPAEVAERLRDWLGVEVRVGAASVHFELESAHERVVELLRELEGLVDSITVARPTLEDVFLRRTGRRFSEAAEERV